MTYINVGGVVAIGFDSECRYMLVVSHSGRGVFEIGSWTKIARDGNCVYPDGNKILGIGPLDKCVIGINEIDYNSGILECKTPDGKYGIRYSEGMIEINGVPN